MQIADYASLADAQISSASHLLNKMVQIGLFPLQSTDVLRVSYFKACWPSIQRLSRTDNTTSNPYVSTWRELLGQLPSSASQTFFTSLLSALPAPPGDLLSNDVRSRQAVKQNSRMLSIFVAQDAINEGDEDTSGLLSSVLLGKTWNEHVARVAVCRFSGLTYGDLLDESGKQCFYPSYKDEEYSS